jgi:signal peptidase I
VAERALVPRFERLAAPALRGLWFVVIPALLAALLLRVFTPTLNQTEPGTFHRFLATAASEHAVFGLAAAFLFFAAVLRYWRALLPGATYLEERAARQETAGRSALYWLLLLGAAAAAALLLRAAFFQNYRVLSSSMLPTLAPGDQLIATQKVYGQSWLGGGARQVPPRGDVVVFSQAWDPSSPPQLVKRVFGLPGDEIRMRGGFVQINGWQVPYCDAGRYVQAIGNRLLDGRLIVEFLEGKSYLTVHSITHRVPEPYVVKPGEVFVLGDNRNNSSDSRAWKNGKGGGLPLSSIRGRVDRVLFRMLPSGVMDTTRLFEPLGVGVYLEGVDMSGLRSGIERCLKSAPKQTTPPKPGAIKP